MQPAFGHFVQHLQPTDCGVSQIEHFISTLPKIASNGLTGKTLLISRSLRLTDKAQRQAQALPVGEISTLCVGSYQDQYIQKTTSAFFAPRLERTGMNGIAGVELTIGEDADLRLVQELSDHLPFIVKHDPLAYVWGICGNLRHSQWSLTKSNCHNEPSLQSARVLLSHTCKSTILRDRCSPGILLTTASGPRRDTIDKSWALSVVVMWFTVLEAPFCPN